MLHSTTPITASLAARKGTALSRLLEDHRMLRQGQNALRSATADATCPESGSAFLFQLPNLASFFEEYLVRHIRSQEDFSDLTLLASMTPAESDSLRDDHTALMVLSTVFTKAVRSVGRRGNARAWPKLLVAAARLDMRLEAHLNREIAMLEAASRKRA